MWPIPITTEEQALDAITVPPEDQLDEETKSRLERMHSKNLNKDAEARKLSRSSIDACS